MAGKQIIKKIVDGGVDFFKDKAVFKRGDYQWVVENNYCFLQERKRYKNIASCAVDVWNDSHRGFLTADHVHCYGSLRTVVPVSYTHLDVYKRQM